MKFILSVIFLFTIAAVSGQHFQNEDSLFYEVPNSVNIGNENFFNLDNKIYKPGKEFIFSYQIIKDRDTLLVRINEKNDSSTPNWTFVNTEDSLTIDKISFKVLNGYGGLDDLFPDYSQTVIQQIYYSKQDVLFDGFTGIIENKYNIWLHPFRGKYFSVLQFSPFPYIKLPGKNGLKWKWKLNDISDRWSDPRIVQYTGKQQATYIYEITGKVELQTPMGKLKCHVIQGTANTSLGQSTMTSYFNKRYGFVFLQYSNIDDSIISLKLIDVK